MVEENTLNVPKIECALRKSSHLSQNFSIKFNIKNTGKNLSEYICFIKLCGDQTQIITDFIYHNFSNNKEPFSTAEDTLLVQYMFSAGIVCGLAINNSMAFPVCFPPDFLRCILETEVETCAIFPDESNQLIPSQFKIYAFAFRRGLISVFPEVIYFNNNIYA